MLKLTIICTLLTLITLQYQQHPFPQYPQHQITHTAISPKPIINKYNNTINTVFATKTGSLIFTNIYKPGNQNIYQIDIDIRIKYLVWNQGGVIVQIQNQVIVFDPVKFVQVRWVFLGERGRIVGCGFREKQGSAVFGIQSQGKGGSISIYGQQKIMEMQVFQDSLIAFDKSGQNLYYYINNDLRKKLTVNLSTKKIEQSSLVNTQTSMVMSKRQGYQKISVSSSNKGITIWQNNPQNTYHLIPTSQPQSNLLFTTNSDHMISLQNNDRTINIWEISFENYGNWKIDEKFQVGSSIKDIDAGRDLIVYVQVDGKIGVISNVDNSHWKVYVFIFWVVICGVGVVVVLWTKIRMDKKMVRVPLNSEFSTKNNKSYPVDETEEQDQNYDEYKQKQQQKQQKPPLAFEISERANISDH